MVDPSRRIFGLETEFGLHFRHGAVRKITAEEVAGALFHSVVQWGRSSNVFLPNGARLYIDVGAHPEYATAECDTLTDLIAQDKAGERIVADLVAGGERRLRESGIEGEIHLYKNNVDSAGNSYGCHENYLVRRRPDFASFAGALLPFLITRQILVGSGGVTGTGTSARYCFSPRADHVWEAMSSATTRSRPMINTRDEPHAHADLYRRMHVIVGDSSMAEPTILLKVGSMDLLIRMLEAGQALPDLTIARPMQAIREVSHDLTGCALVDLEDGRRLTPIQMQEECLAAVEARIGTVIEATPEVRRILSLWRRGLEAVQAGDHTPVETELDWAIKRRLIERFRERTGASLDDPRIARLDLAYHDVAPGHGLYPALVAQGLIRTEVGEDQILRAVDDPPETTRARLRGRFVRAGIESHRDITADWVRLKVVGDEGKTILLKDPFRADDGRVDDLIASMTSSGTQVD
ncbi:MAG: Pup--protein ligase [Demequinaceae bacterium]|nr:Pup--protein ligase [Demequinaceae bacterium]